MASNAQATLAIRLTLTGAQAVAAGMRGIGDAGSAMGRTLGAINEHAFFLMGNLERIVGMAGRVGSALHEAFILSNSDKEQATQQFANLLGSMDEAIRRMDELDAFKMATPFGEKELIGASLTLQRFGDGAMAAGDGLLQVADIAAWAGTPIEQVAQAMGLAYQSIQGGGDLGNAARQLVSMGVISRATAARLAEMSEAGQKAQDVRKQIADLTLELQRMDAQKALQSKGRKGDDPLAYFDDREMQAKRDRVVELQAEVDRLSSMARDPAALWAEFTAELGRTRGAAAAMNQTFGAAVNGLRKQWEELQEMMGESLFGAARADVLALRDQIQAAFDDGTVERWAKTAGAELANLYAQAKSQSILGMAFEDLRTAAESGTLFQTIYAGLSLSFKNAVLTLVDLVRLHGPDIVAALNPSWLPDLGITKGRQQVAALARGDTLTEPLTTHAARMLQDEWARRNPDNPTAKWTMRGIATSDFMSGDAFWKNLGPDVADIAKAALDVRPGQRTSIEEMLQARGLGRWSPAPSDSTLQWPVRGTYSPSTGVDIMSALGFDVASMSPGTFGSPDAINSLLRQDDISAMRARIGAYGDSGQSALEDRAKRLVDIMDRQIGMNQQIETSLQRIVEIVREGAQY